VRLKPGEMIAAVLALVLLVGAVAFGVYPSLRRAPRDQCLANMKQIATALGLYVADTGGALPPGPVWADALLPGFADSARSFVCPEASPTVEQLATLQRDDSLAIPIGFSFFRPLAGSDVSLIADMGGTPMLFDSRDFRPNSVATLEAMDFRHMGRTANVAYADGHGEPLTAAPQVPSKLFRSVEEAREAAEKAAEGGEAEPGFGGRAGEGMGHDHSH